MNKKVNLGFLSVFAVVLSIVFSGAVSAKSGESSQLLSTTIVISQAYGGGGGTTGTYQFDYVELKNISSSPQSLNGLSLAYGSATGQFASSATNIFALPNVTLNPGQYYLVQTSAAGTGGAPLPVTPDATTTNLSMSGTNGKLALVTSAFSVNSCGATATPCVLPNAAIIDLVAWGTANNAEGNAPTNGGASLTATQGNVRKANGCTETDNNNNDFEIVSNPVPRNSATTAAPCSGGPVAPRQNIVDFDGNGRTDFAVVRNTGGGAGGQVTWFINYNQGAGTATSAWGLSSDFFITGDYDGDNKSDLTVWRPAAAGTAAFYILQSATNTVKIDVFGQTGDNPTIVGDYDGDGKDDVAVYRGGASEGQQSTWFYRASANNPNNNVTYVPWGQNGDFVAPGDYDGNGRADFVVQRGAGNQAAFWTLLSTGSTNVKYFGTPSDTIVPGDYDGDGKTDIAVSRNVSNSISWYVMNSSNGSVTTSVWGNADTDFRTQGDYDGDGKTDIAVWRASATPGQSAFYVYGSTSGPITAAWGLNIDYPVANFNTH